MAEGGGRVLLDEEVSGPGEAVGDGDPEEGPPGVSGEEGDGHDGDAGEGTARVEQTISRLAMLLDVESKEVVVGGELLFHAEQYSQNPAFAGGIRPTTYFGTLTRPRPGRRMRAS